MQQTAIAATATLPRLVRNLFRDHPQSCYVTVLPRTGTRHALRTTHAYKYRMLPFWTPATRIVENPPRHPSVRGVACRASEPRPRTRPCPPGIPSSPCRWPQWWWGQEKARQTVARPAGGLVEGASGSGLGHACVPLREPETRVRACPWLSRDRVRLPVESFRCSPRPKASGANNEQHPCQTVPEPIREPDGCAISPRDPSPAPRVSVAPS